jgi:transcription factor RLM1
MIATALCKISGDARGTILLTNARTFLKRKGGLFKKAHELSVLCSVDVAVIIFGHNKKLYEFSSGDIHETLRRYSYVSDSNPLPDPSDKLQYGTPHEHKGPADFKNKGGDDDDDDEEDDGEHQVKEDSLPPQQHPGMMPPHLQHHNSFQHIRPPHQASASPPMQNGMFPRHSTPQPQMDSRPGSRNTIRRTSSNLVPLQHPHPTPPPPQNGFAYVPNPPIYNPQPQQHMQPHPSPQPQFQHFQQHPQQQFLHPQPAPQRPASAPRHDSLGPPQVPPQRQSPQPEFKQPQNTPPQIKHLSSKSRSIFTPIDEGGSVLAQHFFGAPDPPRTGPGPSQFKREASPNLQGEIKPPPRSTTAQPRLAQPIQQPPRSSSASNDFPPPQRSNTSGSRSGARPKLNLTIPSEASDNENSGGPDAPSASAAHPRSANPAGNSNSSSERGENRHIVLPPPSPSASAVLSAGAVGPGNPFARPPPPTSTQNKDAYDANRERGGDGRAGARQGTGDGIETPVSALPSRYMSNELLPSPSNFFSEWGDWARGGGTGMSAVLPSPMGGGLGFGMTPAEERAKGGSWGGLPEKRKGEEEGDSESKRLKA